MAWLSMNQRNMSICICTYMCIYIYGVATISRLLKIMGLSCRI